MNNAANKAIARRYVELYNTGNMEHTDEVIAADFVDHTHLELRPGPEDVKHEVTIFRSAFPDAYVTIEDIISEDDIVAFRFVLRGTHLSTFAGLPATGKKVTLTGMDFISYCQWQTCGIVEQPRHAGLAPTAGPELKVASSSFIKTI